MKKLKLWDLDFDLFMKKVRCKRFIINYHPVEYAYVITIDLEKMEIADAIPPLYETKYPNESFISFGSPHIAKQDAFNRIQEILNF